MFIFFTRLCLHKKPTNSKDEQKSIMFLYWQSSLMYLYIYICMYFTRHAYFSEMTCDSAARVPYLLLYLRDGVYCTRDSEQSTN